jgi:hypothetical protein
MDTQTDREREGGVTHRQTMACAQTHSKTDLTQTDRQTETLPSLSSGGVSPDSPNGLVLLSETGRKETQKYELI